MSTHLNTVVDSINEHLENLEATSMDIVNFKWNNVNYTARKMTVNDKPAIKLTAQLGRLYLTVESGKKREAGLNQILKARAKQVKNFTLYKNNKVTFETITTYGQDISNGDYMTILAVTLLDCEPKILYLMPNLKMAS